MGVMISGIKTVTLYSHGNNEKAHAQHASHFELNLEQHAENAHCCSHPQETEEQSKETHHTGATVMHHVVAT